MLFCYKKEVFVTHVVKFLDKDKRGIPKRSHSFLLKKKTKAKWERQKVKTIKQNHQSGIKSYQGFQKKFFFFCLEGIFFSLASTETEVLFPLGFWDQVIKSLLN